MKSDARHFFLQARIPAARARRAALPPPGARSPGRFGALAGLVIAAFTFLHPAALAQRPSAQNEPAMFDFSVTALGEIEPPPLFYAAKPDSAGGKDKVIYTEIPAGRGAAGVPVKLPAGAPQTLYTRVAKPAQQPGVSAGPEGQTEPPEAQKNGPEEKERYAPYLELPAQKPGAGLCLLFYHDSNGQPLRRFVETTAARHPAGTVRVLNLSDRRIAFSAGGNPVAVQPGGEAAAKPVARDDGRFPFVHYEDRGAGLPPYEAPAKLLRFRSPGQRLLVVFAPVPFMEEGGGIPGPAGQPGLRKIYRPMPLRIYDTVPGAETARTGAVSEAAADPGASAAAPTPPPAGDQLRPVRAEVIRPGAWWADAGAVEIVAADGGTLPFPVRGARGSGALQAGPSGRLLLKRGGLDLASGDLPEGAASAVIALAAPPDAQGACALLAFDNSPQSHPPGARRIFNLTPYQLAYSGGPGGGAVYVNPKEAAILRASAAQVKLALQTAAGWVLLGTAELPPLSAGSRAGIFVYPEGGTGKFLFEEVSL